MLTEGVVPLPPVEPLGCEPFQTTAPPIKSPASTTAAGMRNLLVSFMPRMIPCGYDAQATQLPLRQESIQSG